MLYIEPAYAKINLFLDVLSKRPDGYHEIGTLFQTVSACDTLHAKELPHGEVTLSYSSAQDYPAETDLVYRAAQALRVYADVHQGVALHLIKELPLGAGLGGGSADAAATLRLLNRMWKLGLKVDELCSIGAKLGADVPFLVEGGTALASGIGEILETIDIAPLPENFVVAIATPHCAVPTKAAYSGILPSGDLRWERFRQHFAGASPCAPLTSGSVMLNGIIANPMDIGFDLFNKFEESVLPLYPQIANLKCDFLRLGAVRALMSGSGASVFGFFEDEPTAKCAILKIASTIRWATIARFQQHC